MTRIKYLDELLIELGKSLVPLSMEKNTKLLVFEKKVLLMMNMMFVEQK